MNTRQTIDSMMRALRGLYIVAEASRVAYFRHDRTPICTDAPLLEEARAAIAAGEKLQKAAAGPALVNADLLRGCRAAIAYLADPPSVFPENRAAAVATIQRAMAAVETLEIETTTCRMCDGRGQTERPPAYSVTVETPNGNETSRFCTGCWEREARELPVQTWEDSISDNLAGVPREGE